MIVRYESIRDKLENGDVVLFRSRGAIARLIALGQLLGGKRSRWSHVGIVVHDKNLDQVLLWESTTLSKLEDLETGKRLRGVQTVFLSDRIRSYNGKVAVRRLVIPPGHIGLVRVTVAEALAEARREFNGKPYEKKHIQLAKAALDRTKLGRNRKQDLSSLFCSELVAEVFQRAGLLPKDPPSSEYAPSDFDQRHELPMSFGVQFGPEIRLK